MKSILCALLFCSLAQANIFKKCVQVVSEAANKTGDVATDVANKAREVVNKDNLQEVLNEKSEQFLVIKKNVEAALEEAQRACVKGAGSTARFCFHAAGQAVPITWRVLRFDATMEDFRNGISYPMSDILIKLKDPTLNEKEREKALFAFVLFWPELVGKVGRILPSATTEVGFNAVTGLVTMTVKDDPGVMGDIVKKLIVKRFKDNLSKNEENKHLSLMGRMHYALNKALDFRDSKDLEKYVEYTMKEMGLDRLHQALMLYAGDRAD